MLSRSFFSRDPRKVARQLLGCALVCNKKRAKIVEVEAYTEDDPGSHAYHGKTSRNKVMFEEPGLVYTYLIYGIHVLFNITANGKGIPGAVLIRAVEPLNFKGRTNGPGLLTKALNITMKDYGTALFKEHFHVECPPEGFDSVLDEDVGVSTRVGLSQGKNLPYRFYLKGNPHLSR